MKDSAELLKAAVSRALEAPSPSDLRKLYEVSLGTYRATGFTVHRRGEDELPKPTALSIAQVSPDPGYYLLYLDDEGEEMTDTYHDDLDAAFGQANAEFGVLKEDWKKND
jgi:hypothetical protein